jgi:hypothetical protein
MNISIFFAAEVHSTDEDGLIWMFMSRIVFRVGKMGFHILLILYTLRGVFREEFWWSKHSFQKGFFDLIGFFDKNSGYAF